MHPRHSAVAQLALQRIRRTERRLKPFAKIRDFGAHVSLKGGLDRQRYGATGRALADRYWEAILLSQMSSDLRDQLQNTLGNTYTLERELGGGGMSRVFVAEETRARPQGRREGAAARDGGRASASSASGARSSSRRGCSIRTSCRCSRPGDAGGLPYFTMPFIEGESLRAQLDARAASCRSAKPALLREWRRAGVRARARRGPSRHQAREHAAAPAARAGHRLRRGQGAQRREQSRRDGAHVTRHGAGHAGVHGARAGGWAIRTPIIAPTSTRSAWSRTRCSPGAAVRRADRSRR